MLHMAKHQFSCISQISRIKYSKISAAVQDEEKKQAIHYYLTKLQHKTTCTAIIIPEIKIINITGARLIESMRNAMSEILAIQLPALQANTGEGTLIK